MHDTSDGNTATHIDRGEQTCPFSHRPSHSKAQLQKVRLAEDGWNSRSPEKVSLAYTPNCQWRNRAEFVTGRAEIVALLTRKWAKELDYRLIKELWAFTDNRIAVRYAYEWHDDSENWFRSYGNEKLGIRCSRSDAATICMYQ